MKDFRQKLLAGNELSIYKPIESGFFLLVAILTLVRFKIQYHPKRKLTGPDNRPNQTLFIDASDKSHPIISPEHLGKPMIDPIGCSQRENQRKPMKKNISRKFSRIFCVQT